MALLETLWAWIIYLTPFLFVISVLVFFHELGHYLYARRYGVRVEVFSIGFGPELFGWTDKVQTRWKVSLIPLGGYVKMFGDADAASKPDHEKQKKLSKKEQAHAIFSKTPLQKLLIAFGGPLANFILTMLLFIFLFATTGKKEMTPVIGGVVQGSVAEKIGLMPGDRIQGILVMDDEKAQEIPVDHFRTVQVTVNAHPEKMLRLRIERENEEMLLTAIPEAKNLEDMNAAVGVLGITPQIKVYPFFSAIKESIFTTMNMAWRTLKAIGGMIVGEQDSKQLGGMFMIAKYAHDFAAQGLPALLELMAVLSLNLGLINLFPIPMLDGGHIVFHLVELVRGRPVSARVQDFAFKVGFGIVIALMLFSHWNDIERYHLIQNVINFFK